ncbi:MAG: hypothetical protein JNM17_03590 [Archangium sp.]|nr:hypothetical protein [Archangium sp.]
MPLELRIASPCSMTWEAMRGNSRVRHCDECNLKVFEISKLTEAEVRALLAKNGGRICGQIFKRKDGTVLTRDCPEGVAAMHRRLLAGMSLVVTVAFSILGFRATAPRDPRGAASWFDRVVTSRFIEAREELRETQTFGALINEVWPPPPPERVLGGLVERAPKRTPPTTLAP